MGYIDVFVFLMPLYGYELGLSAAKIGALVGARTFLSLLFSIHVGNLLDRFGTVRVMKYFVLLAAFVAPIYPLTESFWVLLVLQMIIGGAVSFAWAGAQTLIAQLTNGDAEYIGRFSFASRIGTTTAPLVAGVIWDLGGVWPAYLLPSIWGTVLFGTLFLAPKIEINSSLNKTEEQTKNLKATPFLIRDLLPKYSDYVRSFSMMLIPIVGISVTIMVLRISTSSVNNSLYVVYLDGIGMTGTMIGLLFAAIEASSGIGSLMGGRAIKIADPRWLMLFGTAATIFFISITPLLGGIFIILLFAQIFRGLLQGVIEPVMFSVQAKAVRSHEQGAIVGLRQTMHRLSAIIVPPLMGLIADQWGIEESFLILGAGLLFLCVLVGLWVRKIPNNP